MEGHHVKYLKELIQMNVTTSHKSCELWKINSEAFHELKEPFDLVGFYLC